MEKANIILHDFQKNKLGVIQWTSTGQLTADLTQDGMSFANDLELFLKEVAFKGELSYQDNQSNGNQIIEKKLSVKITDVRFPSSLADLINQARFQSKRIFAVIGKN